MSERFPHHPHLPERSKHHEQSPEARTHTQVETLHTDRQTEKLLPIDQLQKTAENQARSSAEMNQPSTESSQEATSSYINHELKDLAYRRTMSRVRTQLSSPEKLFSKMVHAPVIDEVSDFAATTIARPSGILGGSVFALLGSAFVLYLAKHYGFEYNFLLFGLLFSGGFVIGILIELGYSGIRKLRG
jgi:hypothetical protein